MKCQKSLDMTLSFFNANALIVTHCSTNATVSLLSLILLSLRLCHQWLGEISGFRTQFVPIWVVVLGGGFWVTVIMVEIMVDFNVFWVVVIFKFGYSGWWVGLGLSVVIVVGGGRLAVSG